MSGIVNGLIQQALSALQDQIKSSILGLCNNILSLISSGTAGFWSNDIIKVFIDFSKWANMVVFVVAVIFMLFDMGQEFACGKEVDFGVVFVNTVKALIFVQFNALIAQTAMALSDLLTTNMSFSLPTNTSSMYVALNSNIATDFLFDLLIMIFVLIVSVVFFVMSVMRYGSMFVLILSSSMYVGDILRGDSTSMGSWLRQMVAIAGTYTFQYITFYLGLYFLMQGNIVMSCMLWAGMFNASKVLQKFGYSTGAHNALGTAGSLAGQGISLLSKAA